MRVKGMILGAMLLRAPICGNAIAVKPRYLSRFKERYVTSARG
jgi:hypothetical protein